MIENHDWRNFLTLPRSILESDKQALKNRLDEMYKLVDHAVNKAVQSLMNCDVDIAAQVIADDSAVNKLRHEIEAMGVNTVALQQPVARDLRALMTDIYISMELERIADHAVAIARIIHKIENFPDQQFIQPIVDIAEQCTSMLTGIRQAHNETDDQLARDIAIKDDDIDEAELAFNEIMFSEMCSQPHLSRTYTYLLWITHNLEHIGDRIANIAERVVYMATNVTPDLNR